MIKIPQHFFLIKYNSGCYPNASRITDISNGANCQLFAYELLKHFNQHIPPFRSSELWGDKIYTTEVTEIEPLDLLLWNKTPESWGAHVGVYLGDNQVIHLSKRVGKPTVWSFNKFSCYLQYTYFIGAKRVLQEVSTS